MPAAELRFCCVSAARLDTVDLLLVPDEDDDDFDEFVELDLLEALDELEELEELDDPLVADGFVGSKLLWPTPKPMAVASVPLPTIAIESLVFLLVMTSLPLELSEAVT